MSVEKFSFNSSPKANSASLDIKETLTDTSNKLERLSSLDLKRLCDIVSKAVELKMANIAN